MVMRSLSGKVTSGQTWLMDNLGGRVFWGWEPKESQRGSVCWRLSKEGCGVREEGGGPARLGDCSKQIPSRPDECSGPLSGLTTSPFKIYIPRALLWLPLKFRIKYKHLAYRGPDKPSPNPSSPGIICHSPLFLLPSATPILKRGSTKSQNPSQGVEYKLRHLRAAQVTGLQ